MSTKYKFLNPEGIYFVSFAVVNWINIFTRDEYNNIIIDCLKFCQAKKGLVLHAWCLMKNHMHLIFSCTQPGNPSALLGDFKKFTSIKLVEAIKNYEEGPRKEWILKQLKRAGLKNSNNTNYQFWQQDNHPIEVLSLKVIAQKLFYTHNNPVKAGFVKKQEDYIYSSAGAYFGLESLLEVEKLEIPLSTVGYIFYY